MWQHLFTWAFYVHSDQCHTSQIVTCHTVLRDYYLNI